MSKKSIRDKIEKAKKDASFSLNSKEVPTETKLLIKSLLTILDIVVAVLLEKKIPKNSGNSGLPPSKDPGGKNNRNKGKRKNNDKKGKRLDNSKDQETSATVSPNECSSCQANLKNVSVTDTEERKKIDITYEITTHIVTSETKECPECGEKNKGEFPKDMEGKLQYGIGIKAMIINFIVVQMVSLQRIQEYFKGLLGRFISQQTMLNYVALFAASLEAWEKEVTRQMGTASFIHVDETSIKINKKLYWIHSYSNGDTVIQFVHESRGCEAIDDIGILDRYGGILIHDCWGPYFTYKDITHALCLAHLLRELKFVEESTQGKWATNLKKLLQEAIEMVNRRKKSKVLKKKEYAKLLRRYRNILTRALKELPEFPKPKGRGRPKHTDAQNLWLRLKEHESAVLLFARVKDVDPTNNRAERDLRMNKVKQKVSGGFRSFEMAKHYCRISSYIKTMRYKGYSSLEAITMALNGNIPT